MSTTTSFSSNFQLKLIGTGREAGTWGESMNETLRRIESAMGKTIQLDIESMPSGSTSATSGSSWVATWITVDSADDGESGSEGRCKFVDVRDPSDGLGANTPSLLIAGSTASEIPARMYYIKNSLNARDLTVTTTGASATVSIENGNAALVMVVPTATANYAVGVHNILDKVQAGQITFESNGVIEFTAGTNSIDIPSSQSSALTVADVSAGDSYLTFDTSNNRIRIRQDVDSVLAGSFNWTIANHPSAFVISQTGSTSVVNINTSNGTIDLNRDIVLESSATTIDSTANAQTWDVKDADSAALTIESATETGMLVFDTSAPKISTSVRTEHPDVVVTGTDGYIAMNSWNATPANNYGIRNNSGAIEVKDNGGSWASPFTHNTSAQSGLYFKSTANCGAHATGTLSVGDVGSEAHGLGSVPRIVQARLVCLSTNAGYSAGDEIDIGSIFNDADHRGIAVGVNSTNVFFSIGSTTPVVIQASGGLQSNIDLTKWDIYIEVWK